MTEPRKTSIKLVGLASLIGTTIEWYDFFLYGTAAALVLNQLFFPTFDPFVGTLASMGTYAVGFFARPLGGVIIGMFSGVGPAVLSELFPTKIRTTWMSIGYGIANAVFGGFAPMISIALIKATGSPLSPAYFVMLAALLSTVTVITIKETAHAPLQ